MDCKKSVLYIGNFNTKDNVAAFNRAIGVLKLFSDIGYNCHMVLNQNYEVFSNNFLFCTFHFVNVSKTAFYFKSSFITEIIESIDNLSTIVLYNYPSIPFIKIRKHSKKKGLIVISDCTEWYDTSDVSLAKKPIKWFDTFLRMNYCNKIADGVIVISKLLEEKYKTQQHILIYPIIANQIHTSMTPHLVHDGPLKIVYCGFSGKKKDDLIKFGRFLKEKRFTDYIITLIGKIHPHTLKYFNINNINYEYLGYKDHSEALECVLKNECQIIIRKKTRRNNAGFPTKLAESIFFNIPVIVNTFSDIPYLKGDYLLNIDREKCNINSFFEKLRNGKMNFTEDQVLFDENHYIDEFCVFLQSLEEGRR